MAKQPIVRKLVAAVLGAFAMSGSALALDEIEPNSFIAEAQHLEIGSQGSVSVDGVIGTNFGVAVIDVDFYSFDAKAGDIVTIKINGGMGGAKDVDTQLTLFGPGPMTLRFNDDPDNGIVNPGSTALEDARIESFKIPATGTYTVAVTGLGMSLNQDGTYPQTPVGQNGDYTLVISGVSAPVAGPVPPVVDPVPPVVDPVPPVVVPGPVAPTVMQINIDIKPGERIALIHPKSKGRIPVALLSSGTFNALDVDVKSITFGATGNEASLKGCERRGERVDRNRQRDLVCHFETEDAGFATGSLQGVLRGKTRDGRAFEGRGSVKVVQHHDRHHRDRDDDRRGDRDDRHDNRRGHR